MQDFNNKKLLVFKCLLDDSNDIWVQKIVPEEIVWSTKHCGLTKYFGSTKCVYKNILDPKMIFWVKTNL